MAFPPTPPCPFRVSIGVVSGLLLHDCCSLLLLQALTSCRRYPDPELENLLVSVCRCCVVQLVNKHWRQVELQNLLVVRDLVVEDHRPLHMSMVPYFLRISGSLERIDVKKTDRPFPGLTTLRSRARDAHLRPLPAPHNESSGYLPQIIALASVTAPKLHTLVMQSTAPTVRCSMWLLTQLRELTLTSWSLSSGRQSFTSQIECSADIQLLRNLKNLEVWVSGFQITHCRPPSFLPTSPFPPP